MSIEALSEKAAKRHIDGYNCSQAVLLTLYEHMNPQDKNSVIPKIATGFGGGMGRTGNVCGALTGAIMAIGLKYGSNEIDQEKKADAYQKTQTLLKLFEQQNGSVMCRNLTGCDLSTPEGLAKAKQEGVFEKVCTKLIKSAVQDFFVLEKL
ncbi:MAG: C-GCAxxG-C-C family protein [Candidatus Bathyarchaeia archaeon]|jgi:C_GCAxxG_C_C family probable redox protein